jgi:hypothetical protein
MNRSERKTGVMHDCSKMFRVASLMRILLMLVLLMLGLVAIGPAWAQSQVVIGVQPTEANDTMLEHSKARHGLPIWL